MDNAVRDYAAGVAAGLATVAVGHPFDTVKVNLQARNPSAPHASAIQCAGWIFRREGMKGLYKGATSSFVGMAVESSVLFGVYTQTKAALQGKVAEAEPPKLSTVVPSAALGGALISMILCPTELIKCRLQIQDKMCRHPRYGTDPLECIRKTFQTSGVQGLFRGWSATFFRECTGNVCFFATYEISKHWMFSCLDRREKAHQRSSFSGLVLESTIGIVSGGLSGMAFWAAVLPFDVAKTRIQTAVDLRETRSVLVHLKTIHKELGYRGLYAGLVPTLTRAFPANAAAIVTWELTTKLLGSRELPTLEGSLV